MFKSFVVTLVLILSLSLFGCSTGISGLQSYVDNTDGYKFLYPNGWIPVDVQEASEGVDVVFRDLVERTENLSVIISSVPENKTLESLGTPSEVGYRFLKSANAEPNSERQTEFITAQSHEVNGQTYYILEYEVKLPNNQERHNIASVAVSRGKLFTFNLSTSQSRWQTVEKLFNVVVNSFSIRT
ncbi:MAG: photosystem II oxygen evolving complex protein PsbP [Moorea sp. SIO2B7]|nr:photosystem II oxygen evolving complex protein PsbP [Moorena sp. SIO2B7]